MDTEYTYYSWCMTSTDIVKWRKTNDYENFEKGMIMKILKKGSSREEGGGRKRNPCPMRLWKLSANFTLIQCIKIVSRFFKPRYIGEDFLRAEIYRGRLLTLIIGSSSRLLRIRFSADLTMYWFPGCHFRCMKFKPLVIWIWNQNIAISTIVGTSSHINISTYQQSGI